MPPPQDSPARVWRDAADRKLELRVEALGGAGLGDAIPVLGQVKWRGRVGEPGDQVAEPGRRGSIEVADERAEQDRRQESDGEGRDPSYERSAVSGFGFRAKVRNWRTPDVRPPFNETSVDRRSGAFTCLMPPAPCPLAGPWLPPGRSVGPLSLRLSLPTPRSTAGGPPFPRRGKGKGVRVVGSGSRSP
jgi:hypothetical protein